MATLSGAGLPSSGVEMGGGAAEAQRVAGMIGTVNPKTGQIITPDQIIGTSAGGGVRTSATGLTADQARLEAISKQSMAAYAAGDTKGWNALRAEATAIGQKYNGSQKGIVTTGNTSEGTLLGVRKTATSYADQLKKKLAGSK